MFLRPTIEELNLKFLKFSCKDFNGSVSFIWANQEVEFKYYSNKLSSVVEQTLDIRLPPKMYRGTSMDRLKFVIQNGTTGDTLNQGFWGNPCLGKAMEYGHLILCYDTTKCKSSNIEIDIESLTVHELNELRKKYNSEETSKDNKKIFFSMFSPERRGLVHYEKAHGYYIPGDEKEALVDVLIFGGGPDEESLMNAILNFGKCGGSLQIEGKELFKMNKTP